MKTVDFDFDVTARVMPDDPVELRGKSREDGKMIVLDRSVDAIIHSGFASICEYFRPGDLLVLNDSYVLANVLWFKHGDETTHVGLCGHEPDNTTVVDMFGWPAAAKGLKLTSKNNDKLTCTLLEQLPDQLWRAKFEPFDLVIPTLVEFGQRIDDITDPSVTLWRSTPLAYRSVYANKPGSFNVPSAGLHFSDRLMAEVVAKGVEVAYLTLHVGATETFAVRHISEEEIENHTVRSEYFEVEEKTAAQINRAITENRRIIAVGTTVMRTLESLAVKQEPKTPIKAQSGWTDLYIFPGFTFRLVDVLLTNLHQPRSSHIVLTAAFAGKDLVMRSYAEILERGGYEFDMFGDSMLIV
ncbi:S-adenosylmethionine:tRNA ribosyltransferase-isomerase [Nannizzia gypsea CBS 118893]|uniref:S-adenosylmethionine:tRNA ribosyltransferase-isomerase n=1 Tax=Arthroderma gypseum (strain ATCC MYA-4604 / CBS 118893) TaxID=535722 RepID=E4UU53_ARTGP|nr:S-adenosylmethionine:tRNA ribosyltransferase-isomerase [Nannizzia gypsea CBS 118893]EFR00820.1 S-adenosylmethionine:tRNA ribosyltransferase-isomerase [Nannizzia gypsea CBS 118893]